MSVFVMKFWGEEHGHLNPQQKICFPPGSPAGCWPNCQPRGTPRATWSQNQSLPGRLQAENGRISVEPLSRV